MASGDGASERPAAKPSLAETVQANLGRVSHFADGKTPNWTLYFFFRILSESEAGAAGEQFLNFVKAAAGEAPVDVSANLGKPAARFKTGSSSPPSPFFRDWLKVVAGADRKQARRLVISLMRAAGISHAGPAAKTTKRGIATKIEASSSRADYAFATWLSKIPDTPATLLAESQVFLRAIFALRAKPAEFKKAIARIGEGDAAKAGHFALQGGLARVVAYEFLRHLLPAVVNEDGTQPGIVRSEAGVGARPGAGRRAAIDTAPMNIAFTFSGLDALGIDPTMLATFPDAFRQGMAARAQRLGDTGPSAPEHWEGCLGLSSVHGYFTGGFLVGGEGVPVEESLWRKLRQDVRDFNQGANPELRLFLRSLFLGLGMEIVQIELGQDPYEVDGNGHARRLPYRVEHFGFRDGISQPFVELGGGLRDPPPGGGTPLPDGTWAPVAPGEIYLDQPDEDGALSQEPAQLPGLPSMSTGSTFLVFRKLEQDVRGFRAFLAEQRPADKPAQAKLAARFVGRWQNGASLVQAPDAPLGLGSDPDDRINDFRYAADDPKGEKCPLGSHVRRTNPRDTGGANDVRRHRILRRSISYGGPLLPEDSSGDEQRRGLLFVAANSHIEQQFELIQSRWINSGEFFGQAGLARCPVTGANRAGIADAFLEPGAAAPVIRLPRFVFTRGGDYFFAPGTPVLRAIAGGETFPLTRDRLPYEGYSMGDAYTPSLFNPLFDPDRVLVYANTILDRTQNTPVIRVELQAPVSVEREAADPNVPPTGEEAAADAGASSEPGEPAVEPCAMPGDPQSAPVAFVGRYSDVVRILKLANSDQPVIFSVVAYREAARRISRGHDLIVGSEPGANSTTGRQYSRMLAILEAAWNDLNRPPGSLYRRLADVTKATLDAAIRRTAPIGAIDLVNDLATASVYRILSDIFGIPGPSWLTEIAVAFPFYRQHFGELPPDWLKAVAAASPPQPGLATLRTWSNFLVLDLVGNPAHQQELMAYSSQAGGEFLEYLDSLLVAARAKAGAPGSPAPITLVDAFAANEGQFVGSGKLYASSELYYFEVTMVLMELAASAMGFVPSIFGFVMSNLLDFGIQLPGLMPILQAPPTHTPIPPTATEDGVARLIFETCRVNPPLPIVMRRCWQDFTFDDGGKVSACDWVAAMVGAAGMDPEVFIAPTEFSLHPFLEGAPRELAKYLLFGVSGTGRECWGKDKLALFLLKECVVAASRLQNLRKVAGAGATNSISDVAAGLKARFDRPPRKLSRV